MYIYNYIYICIIFVHVSLCLECIYIYYAFTPWKWWTTPIFGCGNLKESACFQAKCHGFLLEKSPYSVADNQKKTASSPSSEKKKKADSSCFSTAVVIFRYAPTQKNFPIPSIDLNPFFGNRKDRKVQAYGL